MRVGTPVAYVGAPLGTGLREMEATMRGCRRLELVFSDAPEPRSGTEVIVIGLAVGSHSRRRGPATRHKVRMRDVRAASLSQETSIR